MPESPMHDDEFPVDEELARRLVARQFPRWASLPLQRVRSDGTDNAIFRLGTELALRLPRTARVADQPGKEAHWLPRLAPRLPLPIPAPVALGHPGEGYPWAWAVCPWLPGDQVNFPAFADPVAAARELAAFVLAFRAIDAAGAPRAGAHNFYRGVPLALRDTPTRAAIAALEGMIDTAAASAAWESALAAPPWDGPPAWLHGDLAPGNILMRDGKLAGVIDFGGLGAGDPACDLMPAWNLFRGASREAFREATGACEADWRRGRGWALSVALIQLPYYATRNVNIAAAARCVIAEVLAEA